MIKTTVHFEVELPEKFSILTEAIGEFTPNVTEYEAKYICSGKWVCRKPDGSETLVTTEEAAKTFFLAQQLGKLADSGSFPELRYESEDK